MGGNRKRRGRNISGLLLLDKPQDISSNRALQRVKGIFNASKAGHTGSLDPLATGLLPICFGEATKFSHYLLDSDKTYEATCLLGVTTSTGDSEGDVLEEKAVPEISQAQLEALFAGFLGEYEQTPPMHSAIKQNGQPLYKLARQGIEVERKSRLVSLYSIDLLGFTPQTIDFRVSCSKGTYIRTLAEEFGEKLGCGAHIRALRRTGVGEFNLDEAVSMDQLQALRDEDAFDLLDELLLPVESLLTDWPAVTLSPDAAHYVKQGQPVIAPRAPTEGLVMLFEREGAFIGVGEILDDGRVAPRRMINAA